MGVQHLDIPALPSPLAVLVLSLWVCFIVGLASIWNSTSASGSRYESRGSAFRFGVGAIAVFFVGYWFVYDVIPYFGTVSKAVLH